jgi:cytochrome c oxidase subunit 2
MRLKRDANPGSINPAWFEATAPGDYAILCQELCAYAHYQMFGQLQVLDQGAFDEWQKEASRMAIAGYDPTDSEAHWAWEWKE